MSNGFIKEKIKTDEKRRQKSDRNLKAISFSTQAITPSQRYIKQGN